MSFSKTTVLINQYLFQKSVKNSSLKKKFQKLHRFSKCYIFKI